VSDFLLGANLESLIAERATTVAKIRDELKNITE